MDAKLNELCDTLSQLCDIPDTSPGALYGFGRDATDGTQDAVAQLYAGVVLKFREHLKTKGLHPESRLVEGFDHEQHFQQVALVSRESAASFVPDIAFSETQLKNIEFPVGTAKDLKRSQDDKDADGEVDESSEGEHEDAEFMGDTPAKHRHRQETALSDDEADDDQGYDEDEDDDLDNDDDADGDDDDKEDEEVGSGEELFDAESGNEAEELDADSLGGAALRDLEDWDQVEAKEPSKNKKVEEKQPMSSYEKSKKKMMEEIRKLEGKQLEEKPWQLKGDIEADKRPQNSLLEEVLEYDITQRPAPVFTEAVTHRLEDVILKRVKDRAFDDVERKIKPVDAPPELKKKIVLDQEKSKLSLAEVYEQEYVKQKSKAVSQVESALPTSVVPEIELSKEEKNINGRLAKLFAQLDCLSNFHYVPPPRLAEVEVVANLPAINVEEVGQDALTSANLLTPGEVSGTLKREIKAPSEKTKTDKKRERRKKKVHQAKKFKKLQLSTSVKAAQPTPGKGKIKLADPALKSSTSFFTQLESQAKKVVDSKKRQAEDDKKNRFKAKKLKM